MLHIPKPRVRPISAIRTALREYSSFGTVEAKRAFFRFSATTGTEAILRTFSALIGVFSSLYVSISSRWTISDFILVIVNTIFALGTNTADSLDALLAWFAASAL